MNLGANLQSSGQWEAALQLSLEGAEIARRHGLDRACGGFLRFNAAESLYELGRWDEMEEQIREADAIDVEGLDRMRSRLGYATVYAGLGRYDDAREHLALARALRAPNDDTSWLLEYALIDARIHAWSGDADRRARDRAAGDRVDVRAQCLLGLRSDAHVARRARSRRMPTTAAEFADALDRWIAERRWSGGLPGDVTMIQAQLEAEQHRDDPDRWQRRRGRVGPRPPRSRTPRTRGSGRPKRTSRWAIAPRPKRRCRTRTRWRRAWGSRGCPRARPRSRARTTSTSAWRWSPATPAEQAGLTAREREVLELLSEGRTNRQIGEVLFISTKTASVHVSNILAKLQVANRGEAAATARRLGLVA